MAVECAELSVDDRTCDKCRHLAKKGDCFPVIQGELGSEPIIDFHHCICYNCGHEWVL